MCGDNWIRQKLLPELEEKSQEKIKSYYYRRLNTVNENYAHLFLCEIADEADLKRNWKHIVDLIAVHVQSEVENLLQRSNFYVWFFVKGEISRSFQKSIEDNTFSSKKYVVEEPEARSEQERIDLIERKLFAYTYLQEPCRQKMIKQVILQNFRVYKGKRVFDFSAGDVPARLVVLFAPNGMGKTSFFDAVEWTFTEMVDRFEKLRNKSVEGAVLRNTEVASSEEASVAVYMDNGEWVKRTVPALNGRTKRDVGKGRLQFSDDSSLERIVGEDKGKSWANLMLQHHKIDGFIAAANPQELYREWCGLWDPSGEARKCFEQSYQKSRQKKRELDEAGENYEKLEVEYHTLDQNRKFVERLTRDVGEFNGLPWETRLEVPDFSVIMPDDYMKWCENIDWRIMHRQDRRTDCEEGEKYIEERLEEDINRYNVLVQGKQENDMEIYLANEKIDGCQRKMELLALRTDLMTQLETVNREVKTFSSLEDRGQEWYSKIHQYFYAPVKRGLWKRNMEDAEQSLRETEMTRDNLRLFIAEKYSAMEAKKEYKILCSHMEKIVELEAKKEELKTEKEEAKRQCIILEEQLSGLKQRHARLEKKYIYSFEETLAQYRQGDLDRREEDRRVEKVRRALVQQLREYTITEEDLKTAGRKLEEEEGMANRLRQIAEEARMLIDEHHLSQCPVCQTAFKDSAMLMQSTYRVSSLRGARLKKEMKDIAQQLSDQKESANAIITEYNLYIGNLIATVEQKEGTRERKLAKMWQQYENTARQIEEQTRQIALLKSADQGQGLYTEYTSDGIEAWHRKWVSEQERELKRLEESLKSVEKKVASEQAYITGLEKEMKCGEERLQDIALNLQDDIAMMQEEKDTILQYTFEDIQGINGAAKREREKLAGRLRECNDALEQYRDLEESMRQVFLDKIERYQKANDEIMQKVDAIVNQMGKIISLPKQARRMEASIGKAWREEAEEKKRQLSEQRQQMEKSLEILYRMQYNREMENYFTNHRTLKQQLDESRSVQEERQKEYQAAEKEYKSAKNRIESSLKRFFEDFPINDIYEKLEPHDTLKQLICEFGFNKEDKPELTFKVVGKDNRKYSPEWYFSTAQLNVVAFSVFLGRALQAEDAPIQSIFIDDPVGHFDEMNVVCFVDLLRNIVENTGRQLIISTHEERVFRLLQRKLPETEYPVRYIDFRDSSALTSTAACTP